MHDQNARFVVLAALDDSALAETTSTAAARYANVAHGAELHFVHVVEWLPTHADSAERAAGLDATSQLEATRVRLQAIAIACKFERDVICHIAVGNAAQEVLQMAALIQADMIFVGTHGRRGLRRWLLGSVAERVAREASCPVLVVRDKDYNLTLAPEIEPPCVDCVAVQRANKGTKLWCARHAERHPHARTHSELPETFAVGSMLLRPLWAE